MLVERRLHHGGRREEPELPASFEEADEAQWVCALPAQRLPNKNCTGLA
jgi:hypothetical protein